MKPALGLDPGQAFVFEKFMRFAENLSTSEGRDLNRYSI